VQFPIIFVIVDEHKLKGLMGRKVYEQAFGPMCNECQGSPSVKT
jgi:hypothetical protein